MNRLYRCGFWMLSSMGLWSCGGFYGQRNTESSASTLEQVQKTDTTYYPNGAIKSIARYAQDRANRTEIGYTEDGLLWYSSSYKDNLRDGKTTQYDTYGLLEYIGVFKAGKRHGWMRHYNENGLPEVDILYEADIPLQMIPVKEE